MFEEYSEKNHEELPPLTIIQGKGTILRDESDRNLIYDKAGLKNYKLVNKDDFILHLRSFEGGLEVANSKGIVSPAYHIFHGENVDTGFYYPFFRSKFFISVLLKPHVYGIRDGKSIDVDGMKTIKIPYPKIEEQQAIGNYFKSLDNLITLHQRKYSFLFIRTFEILKEACFFLNVNAWEQREFSDIAETRRGLTYKPNSIVDNGVRVLRSSNINEDTFVFGNDDVFVDENAVNIPYIQNGDILITSANGSSRLVGKHAIIRNLPDNSAVHGGFMLIASSSNPEFLNASMSSQWYSEFVSLYVAGGNGAIGNLNKNDLDTQIVFVPSVAEQQQIGSYFRNLDNLITLHQRKPFQRKNGGKNYVRRC